MAPAFGQLPKRVMLINRSNTSASAISVTKGFCRPTMVFSRNCRQSVSQSSTKGMNHGTDARLPDGPGSSTG